MMAVLLLVFGAIAVAAVILIARDIQHRADGRPEQVLAERFARGEISADE